MANLKDLIVNGSARIIGKTYSSEFVGNVTGDVTGNLTGNVTGNVSGSSESCNGNAATSSKLKTAVSLTTTDGTHTSTGVNFDGSAATSIKLPTTIAATFSGNLTGDVTGSVSGNAGTATKLETARSLKITDDGTNTSTGVDFDGSGAVTLKLPSTIKASITGNVSGSSGSCTGNAKTATTADKTAHGLSIKDGASTPVAAIDSWNGSASKTLTIKGDSPITTAATANTITITHNKGGANTSKGDTANQTPSFGGTFKVTSATVNAYGHTTKLDEHTVTIPSSVATTGANGLMSSADKTTLDNVAGTYATKEEVGTELAKKANKTHSHAISDITNLQTSLDAKLATSDLASQLLSKVYPVGSIYLSLNNVSPGSFIGGEWEPIKDVFLLTAGDTYAVTTKLQDGGSDKVTLTERQLPEHRHHGIGAMYNEAWALTQVAGYGGKQSYSTAISVNYSSKENVREGGFSTAIAGNDEAHENMPPYKVVYAWRRTK